MSFRIRSSRDKPVETNDTPVVIEDPQSKQKQPETKTSIDAYSPKSIDKYEYEQSISEDITILKKVVVYDKANGKWILVDKNMEYLYQNHP